MADLDMFKELVAYNDKLCRGHVLDIPFEQMLSLQPRDTLYALYNLFYEETAYLWLYMREIQQDRHYTIMQRTSVLSLDIIDHIISFIHVPNVIIFDLTPSNYNHAVNLLI